MKILLYSLIFPPDVCSNAYVFSDLARELQTYGHTISVITTTPHYDSATSAEKRDQLQYGLRKWYRKSQYNGMDVFHIEVAPVKGGIKQRIKTFYRFHHYAEKLIKVENIEADIVMSQTPPMTVGLIGNRLAKKLHAKSIFILQDLWLDSMILKGKIKSPLKQVLRKLELYEYKHADAVCTIADEMAEKLESRVNRSKLHVIPNFVDTDIYHPIDETDDIRRKYGVSSNDFVVSYVGNIGNAQDLTPIIEYANTHQNCNLKVLIAGNGIKYDYYYNITKNLELSNVQFLGFVPRSETAYINAISDVCLVMLAKHVVATSFPSKTYTIMAMGKPILIACSPESVAGKFVEKNNIGWSIDSTNQMAFNALMDQFINGLEHVEKYGKNAYELVKNCYSKKTVGKKYHDLLCELLMYEDDKISLRREK